MLFRSKKYSFPSETQVSGNFKFSSCFLISYISYSYMNNKYTYQAIICFSLCVHHILTFLASNMVFLISSSISIITISIPNCTQVVTIIDTYLGVINIFSSFKTPQIILYRKPLHFFFIRDIKRMLWMTIFCYATHKPLV